MKHLGTGSYMNWFGLVCLVWRYPTAVLNQFGKLFKHKIL